MSMDKINQGFYMIGQALHSGTFTKEQLECVELLCDTIKGSTGKAISRIEAQKKRLWRIDNLTRRFNA
jgi:hypothetical protein